LLLEDGTRLLAATGQWTQAAAHAAHYDDASERLRDSRQTEIIAHLLDSHPDQSLALLDASLITEPREHAVAACLRTYSHLRSGDLTAEQIETTLATVQHARQSSDRDTSLFRIRLGLTAVDLAADICPAQAESLCAELTHEADTSGDAFAAREVLRHDVARARMTRTEFGELTRLVSKAGLGQGTIPPLLLADLTAAIDTADSVLAHTLGVS
jgi:hypothetical protein